MGRLLPAIEEEKATPSMEESPIPEQAERSEEEFTLETKESKEDEGKGADEAPADEDSDGESKGAASEAKGSDDPQESKK